MAAAARQIQQERIAKVGGGGNGSTKADVDGWKGVAVGHGRASGSYVEKDVGLIAARTGDLDKIKELVEGEQWDPAKTVDSLGSCALHWAAGSGHLEVCRYLVEQAPEALRLPVGTRCETGRADGRHALHWAARNNQIRVMEWLVSEHKMSVNDPT